MYVKKAHSILAIIFLAAFLSAQSAVYHSFSHDGDGIENCKVCDEAVTFGHTPMLLDIAEDHDDTVIIPLVDKTLSDTYEVPFHSMDFHAFLYSRPPPSAL